MIYSSPLIQREANTYLEVLHIGVFLRKKKEEKSKKEEKEEKKERRPQLRNYERDATKRNKQELRSTLASFNVEHQCDKRRSVSDTKDIEVASTPVHVYKNTHNEIKETGARKDTHSAQAHAHTNAHAPSPPINQRTSAQGRKERRRNANKKETKMSAKSYQVRIITG